MKLLDIMNGAWAIQPDKLAEIQDIYARHLKGEKIDLAGIEARIGRPLKNGEQGYDVVNGVAIIPVVGVIGKRMNLFMDISGGVSTELAARDFKSALDDSEVESILFEVDSPGGTVDGTSELAQMIHAAREEKPIVTWANGLMASAGYWIGSAAHQVYNSSDTTVVGSIGVVTRHIDYSKMDKEMGIKRTYLYAGKYKVVGADNKPLSKDDAEIIQAELDYLYSIFVDAVAKHRGVDVSTVLDDMADGRIFTGQQAIDAGLVDGVATLDDLIAAMSDGDLPNPSDFSAGVLSETDREKLVVALEADLEDPAETETEQEAAMATETKKVTITKGLVLDQAPEVAEALREEGRASVDVEASNADAATAERERIQAVQGQSMPGHEAMINEMAFDGKTTGPEAAVKILQAVKDKQGEIAANLHKDGGDLKVVKPSADNSAVVESAPKVEIEADASIEDLAKAEWDKDANIRSDFKDNFDAYLSYVNAEANASAKMKGTK